MKEIVFISGKGGTGKTSLLSSVISLIDDKITVSDLDVDAANLHILLNNKVLKKEPFYSGKKAKIKTGHCMACSKCEEVCNFDAIYYNGPGNGKVAKTFTIDPYSCEGCKACYLLCSYNAIEFNDNLCGYTFFSESKFGDFIHAKLNPGEGNSGRLVTYLREKAKENAIKNNSKYIFYDGSPGIGCPVIASITNANSIVIVVEPSYSSFSDLDRVIELTKAMNLKIFSIINKYDLNLEITDKIKEYYKEKNIYFLGEIPYNNDFSKFQNENKLITDYNEDLKNIMIKIKDNLLNNI
jgi:MinD superfamily P-loop ATPase